MRMLKKNQQQGIALNFIAAATRRDRELNDQNCRHVKDDGPWLPKKCVADKTAPNGAPYHTSVSSRMRCDPRNILSYRVPAN